MISNDGENAILTGCGDGGTVAVKGVLQAVITRHANSNKNLFIAGVLEIKVVKRS
jgi:hypothetical protein